MKDKNPYHYSKLRHTVLGDDKKNYRFEYDEKLSNGSFIIDLVQNHGMDQLKEVLNYHNIVHRHNLLDLYQSNTLHDRIYSILGKKSENKKRIYELTSDHNHDRVTDILKHHSSALEYFIINYSQKDIQFIIDEMQIDPDPTKYMWDYSSKTLSFGKKNCFYPTIEDVVYSTIIKIILDESLDYICLEKWLNLNDNILLLLNQYLFDNFNENYYGDAKIKMSILALALRYRKNEMDHMLDQIKTKMSDLVKKSIYPWGLDGGIRGRYIEELLQDLESENQ